MDRVPPAGEVGARRFRQRVRHPGTAAGAFFGGFDSLCELLSSPADPSRTATLTPADWHALVAVARREGVAPLLYHALKEQSSRGAEVPRGEVEPSSSPHPPISLFPHLPAVPADVQAALRQAYYATAARNLLMYQELDRILAHFRPISDIRFGHPQSEIENHKSFDYAQGRSEIRNPKSQTPTILLKGAALAITLYPSIALRPFGDIDLLVREEHLGEAVARLKALGYVEPHPDMASGLNALAGHHVHLQGGQHAPVAVELHWTLIGGQHDWRSPSLPWFWTQTEEWSLEDGIWKLEDELQPPTSNLQFPIRNPKSEIRILTPTAHLLYLSAHLMLQHGEAHSLLRWFYDLHLLVEREGGRIGWEELVTRAREFHWAPAVHAALAGARDRFGTRLPPGVLAALAEAGDDRAGWLVARGADSLQTRATGTVAAALALSPRARLRLLLAIAMPSPAYMRWRYKPHPTWLWPLCYLYRWFDIVREGLSTLWRLVDPW